MILTENNNIDVGYSIWMFESQCGMNELWSLVLFILNIYLFAYRVLSTLFEYFQFDLNYDDDQINISKTHVFLFE